MSHIYFSYLFSLKFTFLFFLFFFLLQAYQILSKISSDTNVSKYPHVCCWIWASGDVTGVFVCLSAHHGAAVQTDAATRRRAPCRAEEPAAAWARRVLVLEELPVGAAARPQSRGLWCSEGGDVAPPSVRLHARSNFHSTQIKATTQFVSNDTWTPRGWNHHKLKWAYSQNSNMR